MASKIVVIGNVNGRVTECFTKLSALQAKQSFAFAIIAGSLFSNLNDATEDENKDIAKLLRGDIEVPLPTYFSIGTYQLPSQVVDKLESNDGELCPNLIAFGRKTRVKTSEGFKLVAIGGSHRDESTDEPMNLYSPSYTDKDASAAKGYNEADILISSEWPADVLDGAKTSYPGTKPQSIQSLAELCTALKPRYYFSTSSNFYEREPFFHNGPSPRQITRFISLASFGNQDKQKWIYAFSLEPSAEPPVVLPEGTTASPFTSGKKRKLEPQDSAFNSFRYSNGSQQGRNDDRRGGGKRRRQAPPAPDQCYFCLSNPACETHMIGSIGSDAYLTIAKGPLTTRSTFPTLGFPGQILIIPLYHAPTIASIPEEESRSATATEMQKYRAALHSMVAGKSKDKEGEAQLGAVTFEISRAGGVHDHWQFLPVPVSLITQGKVEEAFKAEVETLAYPTKFVTSATDIASAEEGDYFKVMVWSEGMRMDMVLPLDHSFRFDLQFGRRVLGKLLRLESRTHWKDCGQSKVEEEQDAVAFKEAFKDFDFSLQ